MSRNRTLGACYIGRPVTSSEIATHERDAYYVEATLGSPVAITLDPFAKDGDQIFIQDANDNAGTQPITILASSSGQILNIGASVQITTNGGQIELTYSAPLGGWLVSNASAAAVVAQTLATFVFQPGGATMNNVYATEAELVTALAKVQGPREVECDFHIVGNAGTIGTVPWTGLGPTSDILVRGNGFLDPLLSTHTELTIANGANFDNDNGGTIIQGFEDLTIFGPSLAGTEPIKLDNSTLVLRNVQYIGGGGAALIRSTGADGGTIQLLETTSIVTGPFYNGKDTSFTSVVVSGDAAFAANVFIGAAGATIDLIPTASAAGQVISISQAGFLGTIILGLGTALVSAIDSFGNLLQIGPTASKVAVGSTNVGLAVKGPSNSLGDGTAVQADAGLRATPAQLTTSDGAAHALFTLTCTPMSSGVVDFIGTIIGIDDGGGGAGALGDAAVWDIRWQGLMIGGVLSNLNGVAPLITPQNSNAGAAGWGGPSAALVGTTLVISVTGQNTHRIRWTILRQQQPNIVTGTAPTAA